MFKATIVGRTCNNPEMHQLRDNKQVCTFRLAVKGHKDDTSFLNMQAWGKSAEVLTRYAQKGKQIAVNAHIRQRSFEKNGQKVTVDDFVIDDFELLGSRQNESQDTTSVDSSEEIPF